MEETEVLALVVLATVVTMVVVRGRAIGWWLVQVLAGLILVSMGVAIVAIMALTLALQWLHLRLTSRTQPKTRVARMAPVGRKGPPQCQVTPEN